MKKNDILLVVFLIFCSLLVTTKIFAQGNGTEQEIMEADAEKIFEAPTEAYSEVIVDTKEDVEAESAEEIQRIFNKNRNTQKIDSLRILYRDQIEAYRNSEKAFNVAKTHYFTVNTLRSLEELVDATEVVMKDRSKVLITYLELLDAILDETAGVELSLKETSLKELRSLIVDIRLHQEKITLAQDRVAVNQLADDFEIYVERYNQVSYKALSLIRIGQIQNVYDLAVLIDTDIKKSQEMDEVGAVAESKRTRAYQEIQRNFDSTNSSLAEINVLIRESKVDVFSRNFYERVLAKIEPAYIQLSQSLNHLEELLDL